ncbi:MAG: hypothetical protein ACKOTB_06345, partial [Planctomycetia bacterium]
TMTAAHQSTSSSLERATAGCVGSRREMRVGGRPCAVRVTPIVRIEDVLGLEAELQAATGLAVDDASCVETAEAALIADLLEARMIAPPRPRRRRDRAVSSRAVFYAATEG